MPKKLIDYEADTETHWDDIFESIEMEVLPIEYLSRIVIKFHNGTQWDIDVDDSKKKQTIEQIEDTLDNLFMQYEDQIDIVDFRLDTKQLKSDLAKRVHKFLKLNR